MLGSILANIERSMLSKYATLNDTGLSQIWDPALSTPTSTALHDMLLLAAVVESLRARHTVYDVHGECSTTPEHVSKGPYACTADDVDWMWVERYLAATPASDSAQILRERFLSIHRHFLYHNFQSGPTTPWPALTSTSVDAPPLPTVTPPISAGHLFAAALSDCLSSKGVPTTPVTVIATLCPPAPAAAPKLDVKPAAGAARSAPGMPKTPKLQSPMTLTTPPLSPSPAPVPTPAPALKPALKSHAKHATKTTAKPESEPPSEPPATKAPATTAATKTPSRRTPAAAAAAAAAAAPPAAPAPTPTGSASGTAPAPAAAPAAPAGPRPRPDAAGAAAAQLLVPVSPPAPAKSRAITTGRWASLVKEARNWVLVRRGQVPPANSQATKRCVEEIAELRERLGVEPDSSLIPPVTRSLGSWDLAFVAILSQAVAPEAGAEVSASRPDIRRMLTSLLCVWLPTPNDEGPSLEQHAELIRACMTNLDDQEEFVKLFADRPSDLICDPALSVAAKWEIGVETSLSGIERAIETNLKSKRKDRRHADIFDFLALLTTMMCSSVDFWGLHDSATTQKQILQISIKGLESLIPIIEKYTAAYLEKAGKIHPFDTTTPSQQ